MDVICDISLKSTIFTVMYFMRHESCLSLENISYILEYFCTIQDQRKILQKINSGSRPSSRSGSVKSGSITGRSYVSSRSGLHSEHGSPEKRSFNKSYPR